jgi:phosphatidate cytidylyltransferase
MAFNAQTFRTRALTAIVFVVVMLAGLLWNYWSFLILFSVIHFGCWWEYLKLVEKINTIKIDIAIKILLLLSGYILFLNVGIRWIHYDILIGKAGMMISLKWMFFLGLAGLLLVYLFQNHTIPPKAKLMTLFGFVYISLSWGLMMGLRREFFLAEIGVNYMIAPDWHLIVVPCSIIASIWINDTMAYIVGSFIGKTPLTKISPKKTWEGTLGGILLAVLVTGIIAWQFNFDTIRILIIAAIAAIFGTFGDLLESKLKRMAGVKDSGSLMPGHGGFLDRFDSLLVATPFVWLYIKLFLH